VRKARRMKTFITTKNASGTDSKMPAGFTLIEVLLVAVVCGLLAGAAGWLSIGGYKRMLVERTAKDVFFAAKYARIFAIEKQVSCNLLLILVLAQWLHQWETLRNL